jgi:sulfate/thiosulfate transport system permease protein
MRYVLRFAGVGYLAALLVIPVVVVMKKAFEPGLAEVWASITTPAAINAFWLTIIVAAIAVPLNAIFGVLCALVLERSNLPGRGLLNALLDLPFAVSPVVIGLALVLVYGREGWLADLPVQILFSLPGIVLATIFVSVPFVAREVAPVLREIGDEAEQAASTLGANAWQAFRRVTLPAIRWGLATGIVLSTARALGEFGAVSVVSGKIQGETMTLTLLVEQRFQNFELAGAYAASALLAAIAVAVLLLMNLLQRRAAQ